MRERGESLPGAIGFADPRDIDAFVETLERYERGEIDADAWRAFRLVNGVYGQRQPNAQMLRIKIPQGNLSVAQLERLALVAERYASRRAHVTTRQNVQLYDLSLDTVDEAMRLLAEVGLTTKEACGSSIRNVTASPYSGVDPEEPFDVTPHAEALTRYFLRGPRSSSLPRKFKIAFESSQRELVRGTINDLAFVALPSPPEAPRFRVLAGGGTATLPRSGALLADDVSATEIFGLAEAVVRVFHRHGDRTNRAKARMKWLIRNIGWSEFERRVHAEWESCRAEAAERVRELGLGRLPIAPAFEPHPAEAVVPVGPEYAVWLRTNTLRQKQVGLVAAAVRLPLGDITPAQLRGLAKLAARFSDGTVRTAVDQNVLFRHVPEGSLPALYAALESLGLASRGAGTLADVTSCAGAHTCALAVTASRGLGEALDKHLAASGAADGTDAGLAGANVRISGCPNGCGQHHVATLGFQGAMRRVGGRPLPLYQLTIGGGFATTPDGFPGTATFGRLVGKIPARRVTTAVDRILDLFRRDREEGERLAHFLTRVPIATVKETLSDLFEIDEAGARADDFVDLGQTGPFVVREKEQDHTC